MKDHVPTPEDIVKALDCLGYGWREGNVTEEDLPELVGALLGMAEVTAQRTVQKTDEPVILQAYRDTFTADADADNREKIEGWENFLAALSESAARISRLHETQSPIEFGDLDEMLSSPASSAAELAMRLAVARIGVSLTARNSYPGEHPHEDLPILAQGATELAVGLRGLAAGVAQLKKEQA